MVGDGSMLCWADRRLLIKLLTKWRKVLSEATITQPKGSFPSKVTGPEVSLVLTKAPSGQQASCSSSGPSQHNTRNTVPHLHIEKVHCRETIQGLTPQGLDKTGFWPQFAAGSPAKSALTQGVNALSVGPDTPGITVGDEGKFLGGKTAIYSGISGSRRSSSATTSTPSPNVPLQYLSLQETPLLNSPPMMPAPSSGCSQVSSFKQPSMRTRSDSSLSRASSEVTTPATSPETLKIHIQSLTSHIKELKRKQSSFRPVQPASGASAASVATTLSVKDESSLTRTEDTTQSENSLENGIAWKQHSNEMLPEQFPIPEMECKSFGRDLAFSKSHREFETDVSRTSSAFESCSIGGSEWRIDRPKFFRQATNSKQHEESAASLHWRIACLAKKIATRTKLRVYLHWYKEALHGCQFHEMTARRNSRILTRALCHMAKAVVLGWTIGNLLQRRRCTILKKVWGVFCGRAVLARTRGQRWDIVSLQGYQQMLTAVFVQWFREIVVMRREFHIAMRILHRCLCRLAHHTSLAQRTAELRLSKLDTLLRRTMLLWVEFVVTSQAEEEKALQAREECLAELKLQNETNIHSKTYANHSVLRKKLRLWELGTLGEKHLAAEYHNYSRLAYKTFCVLSLASAISPKRLCRETCLLCSSNDVENTIAHLSKSLGSEPLPEDLSVWHKLLCEIRLARRPSCPFLKSRAAHATRFVKHIKQLSPAPNITPVKSLEAKAHAAGKILAFRRAARSPGGSGMNATVTKV